MDNVTDFDEAFQNVSTTLRPIEAPSAASIFVGILLLLLVIVTLAGNTLTIWAFVSNVLLRQKPSNLLLLSLSCSDLLVGATGLPVAAIHTGLGYWPLGEAMCVFFAAFSVVGVSAGMFTITAVSLDRYFLVSREYPAYLKLQSSRNVKITIAAAWTLAILISATEVIAWLAGDYSTVDYSRECLSPVRNDPRFLIIIFFLLFVIPFLTMLISTLRFAVLLRRRLRKTKRSSVSRRGLPADAKKVSPAAVSTSMNSEQTPSDMESTEITMATTSNPSPTGTTGSAEPSQRRPKKKPFGPSFRQKSFFGLGDGSVPGGGALSRAKVRSRYVKPAVRLAILLGTFAVCTLPYPVFLVLSFKSSDCEDCIFRDIRNHLSNLLLSNSGLNPFLYAVMHRRIWEFFKMKLTAPCKSCSK